MGFNYFIIFLLIIAISIPLMKLAKYLAARVNLFIDIPNQRSSHDKPVPRCGGVVLAIVFIVGLLTLADRQTPFLFAYLFGGFLIFCVGTMDDLTNLKSKQKIIGMIASAALSVIFGLKLNYLGYFDSHPYLLAILSIVWIYGMINAFNFMDGSDGLVGGASAIGALFMMIISVLVGNYFVAVAAMILLAACLSFLVFNFSPASIFLGDSGSMFLGYNYAVLGIMLANNNNSAPIYLTAIVFVPLIYDSMVTFVRRGLQGKNVIEAHREHLYQRLIILGISHRDVSLIYYAFGLLFGLIGLLFLFSGLNGRIALSVLALAIMGSFSLIVRRVELSARGKIGG